MSQAATAHFCLQAAASQPQPLARAKRQRQVPARIASAVQPEPKKARKASKSPLREPQSSSHLPKPFSGSLALPGRPTQAVAAAPHVAAAGVKPQAAKAQATQAPAATQPQAAAAQPRAAAAAQAARASAAVQGPQAATAAQAAQPGAADKAPTARARIAAQPQPATAAQAAQPGAGSLAPLQPAERRQGTRSRAGTQAEAAARPPAQLPHTVAHLQHVSQAAQIPIVRAPEPSGPAQSTAPAPPAPVSSLAQPAPAGLAGRQKAAQAVSEPTNPSKVRAPAGSPARRGPASNGHHAGVPQPQQPPAAVQQQPAGPRAATPDLAQASSRTGPSSQPEPSSASGFQTAASEPSSEYGNASTEQDSSQHRRGGARRKGTAQAALAPGRGRKVPRSTPPSDPSQAPRPRGRPRKPAPAGQAAASQAQSAASLPPGPPLQQGTKPAPFSAKLALRLQPPPELSDRSGSNQPADCIPAQPSALHYVPVSTGPRPSIPVILHAQGPPGDGSGSPRAALEPAKKRVLPSRRNSAQQKTLKEEEVHHPPPSRDKPLPSRERRDPAPAASKPAEAPKPGPQARWVHVPHAAQGRARSLSRR